jgi:hypothetical protein
MSVFEYPGWSTLMAVIVGCFTWCSAQAVTKAQDGPAKGRQSWTTSRVQGAPTAPSAYRLAPAFSGLRFELPTSIEEVQGLNQMLVTERGGKVYSFAKAADVRQANLVLDLRASLAGELAGQNVSLLDAELHPRFRANRQMFVCYVHPGNGGHTRVSRLAR